MMKTYSTKAADIKREWHLVDASDKILGKLATRVASLLIGKHKPIFNRHLDVGDYVVVTNAARIGVTGNKRKQKMYYRHTGYPGGLKSINLEKLLETDPRRVIEYAVKGMLPQNRLRARMLKRLRIFPGEAHPHQGQLKVVTTEEKEEQQVSQKPVE